jgi:hypothetical protein
VIARVPTGADGTDELWKLNHYYDRLTDWEESRGIPPRPLGAPECEARWELHDLTNDPEERTNLADAPDRVDVRSRLQAILERTRQVVRRTPQYVNPTG